MLGVLCSWLLLFDYGIRYEADLRPYGLYVVVDVLCLRAVLEAVLILRNSNRFEA